MIYDEKKQKWEKQPKEPKNAYKYFSFYLTDQCKSPRGKSYDNVCTNFSITKTTVYNYANKFDWEKRADAYNQYLAEQNRQKLEKEYEKVCNETMLQIVAISQITGQKINSIITKVKNAKGDEEALNEALGNITLPQLSQVLKLNQDIMKTILRIPDNQEVNVTGNMVVKQETVTNLQNDINKLSPEEREMYLELCEKVNNEEE